MADKWDDEAARLLPCVRVVWSGLKLCDKSPMCGTCYYRPVVAARLRAMGERIAALEAECATLPDPFGTD